MAQQRMTLRQYLIGGIGAFILAIGAAVGIQTFGNNTFGASVFATFQGGTGTSSPSGILYGSGGSTALQTVGIGSGLSFSGGTLSASGGAVTSVTGTYPVQSSGGATPVISLAFGTTTANTWGALNTFTNASSTFFSAITSLWIPNSSSQAPTQAGQLALDTTNDQIVIGDGTVTSVFDKRRTLLMSYASTTAWAGTTTLPSFVIPFGFTWNTGTCIVQPAGATLFAQYQYANPAAYATVNVTPIPASSTPGIYTFSTNNTPTAQATSTISFGNPANSPTSVSCTLTGVVTAT